VELGLLVRGKGGNSVLWSYIGIEDGEDEVRNDADLSIGC
jgi:hypothetical protein